MFGFYFTELKYTYKGKKLKNKLQSKLKRKKKIYENKNKRNVSVKENTSTTNSKCDTADSVKVAKPVFNSEGNLVFSKFDFLGETSTINDKKTLTKDVGSKKSVLSKLEKNQQLIKRLEKRGDGEKATRVKEDIAWKNMLRKAEGVKVKDDPALLKKSLAKKQSQKKRSKEKWDERIKTVEKQKSDKQKKRTENIQKRAQEKKKKKFKKATKKGRYIPNA